MYPIINKFSITKLCPTLFDPMDCSPSCSSIHGISQAGLLEWVAISSFRGSSQGSNLLCLLHQKAALYCWGARKALAAALFTVTRTGKQPKCPSAKEWIKKMWCVYTTEYYSAIKEWNWLISRDLNGPRDCHTEWNKSEREKQTSYINTHMWNLEK